MTPHGSTARVEGLLSRVISFYDRTLPFALEHRALMLIVFVATIALTIGSTSRCRKAISRRTTPA